MFDMTDRETLLLYRLNEAEETLADAKKMLDGQISPRRFITVARSLRR
jgi:hypothetical protein